MQKQRNHWTQQECLIADGNANFISAVTVICRWSSEFKKGLIKVKKSHSVHCSNYKSRLLHALDFGSWWTLLVFLRAVSHATAIRSKDGKLMCLLFLLSKNGFFHRRCVYFQGVLCDIFQNAMQKWLPFNNMLPPPKICTDTDLVDVVRNFASKQLCGRLQVKWQPTTF